MKNLVLMAALALTVSATAHAQSRNGYRGVAQYGGGTYTHEVQTYSTNGGFTSGEMCKDCDTATALDLGGSYLWYWKNNLQFGGDARLQVLNSAAGGGDSSTAIDLIALAVYNFDTDLKNTFYVKGGLGVYNVYKATGGTEGKFGLQVGGGKRFELFNNIAYTPELNLIQRGDLDLMVQIKMINLSIFFN